MAASTSSAGSTDPKAKRGRGRPATDPVVVEVFNRLLDWDVPDARAAVLCKFPKRGKPKKRPEALGRGLQVKLKAERQAAGRNTSAPPYPVARSDWKNIPDAALRLLAHAAIRSGKFERMVRAHYVELLSAPGAPTSTHWDRLRVADAAVRRSVALSEKMLWEMLAEHVRAAAAASEQSAREAAQHVEQYRAEEPERRAAREALLMRWEEEKALRWPKLRALLEANPIRAARLGLDPARLPQSPPPGRLSAKRPALALKLPTQPPDPPAQIDADEFLVASERHWGRVAERHEVPAWLLEAWDRRHSR